MVYWLNSLLHRYQIYFNPSPNQQLPLLELIPDELLVEIFTRLRDEWSIFRCGAVCKRWSSLIRHNIQYLLSSTTTILFRFSYHKSQSFHALSPGRSSMEALNLEFLPFWPNEEVRASCQDLLLVSQGRNADYLVCNPLTRQWTPLPAIPKLYRSRYYRGHGLVLGPKKDTFVVAIFRSYDSLLVFSSETGQWSRRSLPGTITRNVSRAKPFDLVTTRSGTLHWLDGTSAHFKGIAAHNPLTNKSNFIQLPLEKLEDIIGMTRPSKEKILLGVVNGRLRLSHMVKDSKLNAAQVFLTKFMGPSSIKVNEGRSLKIWELEEDCTEHRNSLWKLVHNVTLKKAKDMSFVLAMHPSDGDVVFVVCDREIFSHNLGKNEYIKVGEFPSEGEDLSYVMEKVALSMKVFPLVHSLLPTPLPQLPSI